jgi:hypothetical protein
MEIFSHNHGSTGKLPRISGRNYHKDINISDCTYSSVVSGNAPSYRNVRISTNSASSVSQLPFTEVYIGRKSSVSTYVCIMQFTYLFDRLSIPPPTNTLIIPNFKNEIPYFHPFLQISQIFSPFFLIIYPLFRIFPIFPILSTQSRHTVTYNPRSVYYLVLKTLYRSFSFLSISLSPRNTSTSCNLL